MLKPLPNRALLHLRNGSPGAAVARGEERKTPARFQQLERALKEVRCGGVLTTG